ncbi:MAG: alpha/beta hydrolase [Deltaproteobacteria bacterium]|nr:alpha/beta hydrolase [Deltaproteobacteria bacterium]
MPQKNHGIDSLAITGGNINIAYETFGKTGDPPLLLIMGLGYQMMYWDEDFCTQLADRGYRVIRFDNRDTGLSTWLDDAGVPDIPALKSLIARRKTVRAPYSLRDMADDAVGLLDALNIESAHVAGRSMGGMIGQMMAIQHPDRVRTLTSMMSSTSAPGLPPPEPGVLSALLEPEPKDEPGFVGHSVHIWKLLSGRKLSIDEDRIRKWARLSFTRGLNPDGVARQFAAIISTGSRREALESVTVPTLVIHGESDPLVPLACGIDTANAIPGAKLLAVKNLGHTLEPAVYPQIIDAISHHAV